MTAATESKHPLGLGEDSTGAPLGKDPKNPKRDDKVTRMGTASIPRLIVEFAIPSILGMLVNGAYNIISSIFLGQALGDIGIETMTIVNPIMIVFMAISMLVGVGGNALAALRMGEGRRVDAEYTLGNTFVLCIVVSALVALCTVSPHAINVLLTLSSATDAVRSSAEEFLRIICLGFFFQCVGMGINNFIRTAGAPGRALMTMVIGAVGCTIFSYIFVIQLGWGIKGGAYATICGQALSCVTVLWYFIFTKGVPMRLRLRYMVPKPRVMLTILSFGLASFCVQAGMALVSFITNHLLVIQGGLHPLGEDLALTSIGVVQRIAAFVVFPLIGVAVAIQPLIGFNYGAGLIDRVRKTFWYGVLGASIIGVCLWAALYIFADPVVRLFGISEGALAEFTIFALKVQLLMLPVVGFQIVGSNYFQATGQPLKSVILTLTRQILFLVPLLFILPQVLPEILLQFTGLDALYFATPLADALAIFTTAIFVFVEMKRLKRLERGEIEKKHLPDAT